MAWGEIGSKMKARISVEQKPNRPRVDIPEIAKQYGERP